MWEVEFTDEFEKWWQTLDVKQQEDVLVSVELLRNLGPHLARPYADTVKGSKHKNMKELRTQSKGRPLRTFYAFDPRRYAVLLLGGDKKGNSRFYQQLINKADQIYDRHLNDIKKKG
ncbi:Phage-related protein [Anaerohalosphaera lusitana]|uniref:Phage-related protein n=1 Tax=Anaerohalosphaera lusitana TaxID=1936003 RepID=A0A1U9NHK8_9BACT|nr:type II toxin-antitoxin system RelE/ParE family toxin [Anaerohalosphaera lusitana]AQT67399.1 Phage-related protein [Anaerohalosphaera lusitana]